MLRRARDEWAALDALPEEHEVEEQDEADPWAAAAAAREEEEEEDIWGQLAAARDGPAAPEVAADQAQETGGERAAAVARGPIAAAGDGVVARPKRRGRPPDPKAKARVQKSSTKACSAQSPPTSCLQAITIRTSKLCLVQVGPNFHRRA